MTATDSTLPGSESTSLDVVIIGGGPAGSTVGSLLRKYNPALRVAIVERAAFPRPHIGESQLPEIGTILNEMGVWDAVEAANFPVKIGATFSWGRDDEKWDFDFYPVEEFVDEPRPGRYEGQRRYTAFQVDRAVYDDILLRHARDAFGVEVIQPVGVRTIERDPDEADRVVAVELDDGRRLSAKWFVDATGAAGLLRRAMGVESEAPRELRNIAIWDYWRNAKWAINVGVGGTRIQVRTLPYGWVWFIPLGPELTSVGLVCPSEYYQSSERTKEELYRDAIFADDDIARLLDGATPRGEVEATKDWSHLAERLVGANWFLVGEAAGFADPILSAGMTLAHTSGREAAYTILELERGELDAKWLMRRFDEKNRTNIRQHIRFAQYWYAVNERFTDLKEHCRKIAREAGLQLSPSAAWDWLARGGFTNQQVGNARFGSFDVFSTRKLIGKFQGKNGGQGVIPLRLLKFNVYRMNLAGAKKELVGDLRDGRIIPVECYRRGDRRLPLAGCYGNIVNAIAKSHDAGRMFDILRVSIAATTTNPNDLATALSDHMQALEAMLADGWVTGKFDKRKGTIQVTHDGSQSMRPTKDGLDALRERGKATWSVADETPD
ncbi:MAG: NAD(P)/FAD-dependent oxidoreductase [Phycisphaerales bacterium]